jgi:aminoglycoside phosphotransferase family enzyme
MMGVDPVGFAAGRRPLQTCPADAPAARAADPGLGAKVAFLSRPEIYPDATARVETIETHMSWVFLTQRHAWKLKKPVRTAYLDFSSVTARLQDGEAELALNRRLSTGVYLGLVPLAVTADGSLALGSGGRVVDWLVRMRRLPGARMLDRLIASQCATADDVRRVGGRLARFYHGSAPAPMTPERYRRRFAEGIAENRSELSVPAYGLPQGRVAAVCTAQDDWVARHAALLDARVREGRVIEAHGDLRPEHICLEDTPQIIDCLEFSRDLRTLDTADELAFLALECERLGAAALARPIVEVYTSISGDDPSPALFAFYRSYRAGVRARLALRHLADPAPREPSKWVHQARAYLHYAEAHIAAAR